MNEKIRDKNISETIRSIFLKFVQANQAYVKKRVCKFGEDLANHSRVI